MLSSGSVGSIAFELNKSDLTSPADEQAADGARPEIPQNDLVTTPSGRWNFEPAPTNSGLTSLAAFMSRANSMLVRVEGCNVCLSSP